MSSHNHNSNPLRPLSEPASVQTTSLFRDHSRKTSKHIHPPLHKAVTMMPHCRVELYFLLVYMACSQHPSQEAKSSWQCKLQKGFSNGPEEHTEQKANKFMTHIEAPETQL